MSADSSGSNGVTPATPLSDAYVTFSPQLLAMEDPPKTDAAVVIHEMAAQLVVQQVDRGRRGVAICTPNRAAGTSLLAANLAIAVAQAGVSVLLVDGNLHDPTIETLIAPSEPIIGLQQVLRSEHRSLEGAILPHILPGLSLLYAGGACADASDLIGGFRCSDVLGRCLRSYEYTIVDTPPANRSTDARRLAAYVGYGLIVARRNRTYLDDVRTLAGEIAEDHGELIGTIYNDA